MKIGIIGPSYTAQSSAVADEELQNWYAETLETPGAQTKYSYFRTPGLLAFSTLPESPVRGQCWTGLRYFAVGGSKFVEMDSAGGQTARGTIENDGLAVSIAASSIQLLIVSAGKAYCFTLADSTLVEVTNSLAGIPMQVEYSDGYFIIALQNSDKFQMSDILDGISWPGLTVNAVSVFPENIVSIKVIHRELWIYGSAHSQAYYDSGSDNIFDVIPGAFIETGSGATFGPCLLDNTNFWVNDDIRGARVCWRASGYTPQRISTHAVETYLSALPSIANLVSYAYQDAGHLFWVLYIPGADCTWTYDVSTSFWSKRGVWDDTSAVYGPHWSWNHAYAFGKHLVGDWNTGIVYDMSRSYFDDNGTSIRRLRRSPIIVSEMARVYHAELTLDFMTGVGPQPPLQDGNGNDRPPQVMLRWSDDRGMNWSNEHTLSLGYAGQYQTRVIQRRLGNSRYRVYEFSMTDPVEAVVVDGYLITA